MHSVLLAGDDMKEYRVNKDTHLLKRSGPAMDTVYFQKVNGNKKQYIFSLKNVPTRYLDISERGKSQSWDDLVAIADTIDGIRK